VARYILQDTLGYAWPKFREVNWRPGMLITSALVSVTWGYLVYTGDISSIWPMFGATNQTLSALALAVGTTLILRITRRKSYALITMLPCLFLTLVTYTAGILNVQFFAKQQNWISVGLSVAILVLVTVVILDNMRVWFMLLKPHEPIGLNNGPEMAEPSLDVND